MKRLYALFLFLLFSCSPAVRVPIAQTPVPPITIVYFSPKGGCAQAIIEEVGMARKSIFVQAYSFTYEPIAEALIEAHKRGVRIGVVMGRGKIGERGSQVGLLFRNGIPVRIDGHVIHSKVIIIDEEVVITGSFNFSKEAEERNVENLLILRDKVLAQKYIGNFREREELSEKYKG